MNRILWDLAAEEQTQILFEKVMLLLVANLQLIISLLHQAHNLHDTNCPPVYLHGFLQLPISISVQTPEKKIWTTSSYCKHEHVKHILVCLSVLFCFYSLICVRVNSEKHKRLLV